MFSKVSAACSKLFQPAFRTSVQVSNNSTVQQLRHLIQSSCSIRPTQQQPREPKEFFLRPFTTSTNPSEIMPAEKPKIVFVLGGPGAGKGTQCSKIVERFQFVHLSAGDLLREERARKGSEYGELIEDYIKNGKIVPVEVTCSLLEKAMQKSGSDKFLIDGFPRNQDNLEGWTRQMTGKVDLQFVLFFNCAENVCVERCLSRGQGGSGRSDDNMESLKKRIQTYTNDSLPIIEHFEHLGQVKKIDASPSATDVFDAVEKVFQESGFQ